MNFNFPLILPSSKKIRVPEVRNRDIFDLIKYCMHNDIEGFNICINNLIFSKTDQLNIVDKFYTLLFLRILYIGDQISLPGNTTSGYVNISLNEMLEKFERIEIPQAEIVVIDDFTVELGIPTKIYFSSIDELYFDLIKSVKYGGDTIRFDNIDESQKDLIISTLPVKTTKRIIEFYTALTKTIGEVVVINSNDTFNLEQINLNFLSNQPCTFIKQLYSQDLNSFLEFMYHFVNKIGGTFNDFLDLNTNDCKIMFNFYVDEIKKQNDELKSDNKRFK
jgi:hypothetical protein